MILLVFYSDLSPALTNEGLRFWKRLICREWLVKHCDGLRGGISPSPGA